MPGLAGTLEGDDTVLCMIENPKYIHAVCTQLGFIEM